MALDVELERLVSELEHFNALSACEVSDMDCETVLGAFARFNVMMDLDDQLQCLDVMRASFLRHFSDG